MFRTDANSVCEVMPVASKTLCRKESNLGVVISFTWPAYVDNVV
jgi:hypothetical protein